MCFVSLIEYIGFCEIDACNIIKQKEKEKAAKEKAEKERAIQAKVLAPLPPVTSRMDEIPITCYRYDYGKKSYSDNDDAYRAMGMTGRPPAGTRTPSPTFKDDNADRFKAERRIRGSPPEKMYDPSRNKATGITRGGSADAGLYSSTHKYKNDVNDDSFRATGITRGGPDDISTCASTYQGSDDDSYCRYSELGIKRGRAAGIGTYNDKHKRIKNKKSITGNRTADLFLFDGYYNSLIRKIDGSQDRFLEEYMVNIVRADSVHAWACEQMKSAVLTSSRLMEQVVDIFEEDQAIAARDKNVKYSWRDYRKFGDKMADVFAAVVNSQSKPWLLYSNEKLVWFYFRSWFLRRRMSHCLITRAKLEITSFKFSKEARSCAVIPAYDKMYQSDEVYRALKTLDEVQHKARSARRYKYGYEYERTHGQGAGDEITSNNSMDRPAIKRMIKGGSAEAAKHVSTSKDGKDNRYGGYGETGITRGAPSEAGTILTDSDSDDLAGTRTERDEDDNDEDGQVIRGASADTRDILQGGTVNVTACFANKDDAVADNDNKRNESNYNERAAATTTPPVGYDGDRIVALKAKAKRADGDIDVLSIYDGVEYSEERNDENADDDDDLDMDLCSVATSFIKLE